VKANAEMIAASAPIFLIFMMKPQLLQHNPLTDPQFILSPSRVLGKPCGIAVMTNCT
jgi:hypothetical protein